MAEVKSGYGVIRIVQLPIEDFLGCTHMFGLVVWKKLPAPTVLENGRKKTVTKPRNRKNEEIFAKSRNGGLIPSKNSSPVPDGTGDIDSPTYLNFPEAMIVVIHGGKITRKEWESRDNYVYMDEYLMIHLAREDALHELLLRNADILAEDWFAL